MSDPECMHLMDPRSCTFCTPPAKNTITVVEAPLPAKYPGLCAGCDRAFGEGTMIWAVPLRYRTEYGTGWITACCARQA